MTTSPGRVAFPPGMFSVAGMMPTRCCGRFSAAAALSVPSTLPAPHMSNFISSIAELGLMEIPPVSNVTPLPTRAIGAFIRARPRYSMTISCGSSALPCATARNAPMLRFSSSRRPNDLTVKRESSRTSERASRVR